MRRRTFTGVLAAAAAALPTAARADPSVVQRTLGPVGGGYDFEVAMGDPAHVKATFESALVELQALVDAGPCLRAVLDVAAGTYELTAAIDWPVGVHDVCIRGASVAPTTLRSSRPWGSTALAINTIQAPHDCTVRLTLVVVRADAVGCRPDKCGQWLAPGVGILVGPGPAVAYANAATGLVLHSVHFDTVGNAIYYDNRPTQQDPGRAMGDIVIKHCYFPRSCLHLRAASGLPEFLHHKVLLRARKELTTELDISDNTFVADPGQHALWSPTTVGVTDELHIFGDPAMGFGMTATAVCGGTIARNTFTGASRECLYVGDYRQLSIHDNIMSDSRRVGMSFVRGHDSLVAGNVIDGAWQRGLRIDYCSDCTWVGNEAYDVGKIPEVNPELDLYFGPWGPPTSGISLVASTNNVVEENIIEGMHGFAVAQLKDPGLETCPGANTIVGNDLIGPAQAWYYDDCM
ncbi:MAG: right-handed parallel beta-helix repeat-containing protein [Myxococcota bacterium]